MWCLDRIDALIYKVCPFVAAGVVVGAIYWTAVTYGAITTMQVCFYIKKCVFFKKFIIFGYI